ncbi:MAG: peptidoglycan -binding protein, partial [Pseudomonadota bacterium]
EVAALTAAAERAEAERADVQSQLASLEARSARLQELEEEREALNQTTLTLRERVAALELSLEERRKQAEETLLLLAAAEKKAEELSEEAKAAAEKLTREQRLKAFAQAQLADEQAISSSGREALALVNAQIRDLRSEISSLRGQLDEADQRDEENQVVIEDLGQRLNRALAQKVNELQRYRSEFFGRLRDVLGERSDIRVVGDRFVFQSEVLFAQGSAELGGAGKQELSKFAGVIREIAPSIPDEVNWILRVDGHTDRVPISGGIYRNNWELSQARALSVVEYLISVEDLPPDRLAATGFGEFQPLDPDNTREAYAKNRRIELKLTER